MKLIISTLLALVVSLNALAGKVIKDPVIEYRAPWMTITEVELTKEATIVRAALHPGSSIISKTYICDRESGKRYKYIRVEGVDAWARYDKVINCSIYFEPLDANVKEFNYIEEDNPIFYNFYGISLIPKNDKKKKSSIFDPETLSCDYYMQQPFTPEKDWHFSNEPYKNLFKNSGKAQMKIHICNLPKELHESEEVTMTARVTNQITGKNENKIATLDSDNCLTFDFDLPYPQWLYVSEIRQNIFVIPGDTLDVYASMEIKPDHSGMRFTTFKSKGESAIISTLLPQLLKKYDLEVFKEQGSYNSMRELVAKGKDTATSLIMDIVNKLNKTIESEDLRQALINSPLSTFGKDVVMASAIASQVDAIASTMMTYEDNNYLTTQLPDGSWKSEKNQDYVPLDYNQIFDVLLKHKSLIFDNPVMFCEQKQWVFVNRVIYSKLFSNYEYVEYEPDNFRSHHVDKYGMIGTFMYDIYSSQQSQSIMEDAQKNVKLGIWDDNKQEALDIVSKVIGESLAEIQNVFVAQTVLNEYRKLVKATETSQEEEKYNWTDEQKAIFSKLIAPYKGNALFLDFWSMSCGPCRSGMMSQKKLVENFKDQPVKFLYINVLKEKDKAEEWMTNSEIKGEHIFLTDAEWNQLETMFSINSIPRGMYVNKQGKIVDDNFRISQYDPETLKMIINK